MITHGVRIRVPSLSGQKGGDWTVERKTFSDRLHCDCPAYGRGGELACKHTRLVAAAFMLIEKCRVVHGENTGRLCAQCLISFMAIAKRKIDREYEPKSTEHKEDLRALSKLLATKKIATSKDPLGLLREWATKRLTG